MSKMMTLRGRCNGCDRAVELCFTPWAGTGPATAAPWECPACCAVNHLPAIGIVTRVELPAGAPPPSESEHQPVPARAR